LSSPHEAGAKFYQSETLSDFQVFLWNPIFITLFCKISNHDNRKIQPNVHGSSYSCWFDRIAFGGRVAYYTTEIPCEQSEQGRSSHRKPSARELAAIAVDFLMKTIEKYKGG